MLWCGSHLVDIFSKVCLVFDVASFDSAHFISLKSLSTDGWKSSFGAFTIGLVTGLQPVSQILMNGHDSRLDGW